MPQVHFRKSNKTVAWDASFRSLLAFAEAQGIVIDYCCRAGVDGVCQTRLIAGQVNYPDSPCWEIAPDHILPCLCVPVTDIEVDA